MKLTSNYSDLLFNEAANAEWCEFIADKIRGIVARPGDRRAADPHGPPLRREATAVRRRLLRGVQRPEGVARRPPGDADRAADRDRASRRPTACGSSTSSCGPPASTSAPARWPAWGSGAGTASSSPSTGPTAPRRSSASRPAGSRTSSSPADRTRPPATTRATTATRSTSSPTCSSRRRERGYDVIEVSGRVRGAVDPHGRQGRGEDHVRHDRPVRRLATSPASRGATCSTPADGLKLFEIIADVVEHDYAAFELSSRRPPNAARADPA